MIKDRNGNVLTADSEQEKTLSFLYSNSFGRIITKLLCRRFVSKLGRLYMCSPLSKRRIKKLVSKHNINMDDYIVEDWRSFNQFFIRKIKEGRRSIDQTKAHAISPADSKLTVYDIGEDSVYKIKGCDYSVVQLLGGDRELAKHFFGGKCFIYRLTVDNYHRYCYPDNCVELEHRFIPGVLHTVNPIATSRYDVYGKNCRELTILETESFGTVAYIEVGAMMVGQINNRHPEQPVARGDEKGYFSFGGSTIILLYKKDAVVPDGDIAANSLTETETAVLMGEKTGVKAGG
ncbi:MAG: phosphatidylserine decarboxylase [Clostridia bacterium]|nr:phosphatidylserine decarboxylase [Clostridia bacterium]